MVDSVNPDICWDVSGLGKLPLPRGKSMGHYSINPGSVECVIFKERGKWYCDVALDMTDVYDTLFLHEAILHCLYKQYEGKWIDMWAVVMDPYHRDSHSQMIKINAGDPAYSADLPKMMKDTPHGV